MNAELVNKAADVRNWCCGACQRERRLHSNMGGDPLPCYKDRGNESFCYIAHFIGCLTKEEDVWGNILRLATK